MKLDLADVPRWVEAHGIAADPAGWKRTQGDTVIAVGHDLGRLVVITDRTLPMSAEIARDLCSGQRRFPMLIDDEAFAREVAASTGRNVERAIIHTLPDSDALIPMDGAVLLPADQSVEHLAPAIAGEVNHARRQGKPIWCAYVDDEPVAFAYAVWRSEKWFDISVDVDQRARQLGLGAIVSTALILSEREQGREPVWGADENNIASQRLAHRLGFVATDELWVIAPH